VKNKARFGRLIQLWSVLNGSKFPKCHKHQKILLL